MRFKEQKDEIEKNNVNNLYKILQFKAQEHKDKIKTINEQNIIIKNMKNNPNFIRRKNKLARSMSIRKAKINNKIELP